MRRILALLLVAVIAYFVGAATANGSLQRMINYVTGDTNAVQAGASGTAAGSPDTSTPQTAGLTSNTATVTPASSQHQETATQTATSAPAVPPASATATATATRVATATPSATASASATPTPPAVQSLAQKNAAGTPVAANGWVGNAGVTVEVLAPPHTGDLRAEVEVQPAGRPFTGASIAAAPVIDNAARIQLQGLAAGHYHWRARLTSADGDGAWLTFVHGAVAFNVQLAAPSAPAISSPTNPRPNSAVGSSAATFTWTAPSDPSGIAGYSWRLDTDPQGSAHQIIRALNRQVTVGGLPTGTYYFHLRAVDNVGNWGPSATYPIRVDLTKPDLVNRVVSGYYVNPALESLTLHFRLTKVSHVTVGIYDPTGTRVRHIVIPGNLPANVPLTVAWDGRDNARKIVPAGEYAVWLRATDRIGNAQSFGWGYFNVTQKRIFISLSQQRLQAYDGDRVVIDTLVTTGNRVLPTPTGLFHIIFARHPFTFVSMWPKGSPYYYKPSPVSYALYFKDYGYYIHDAPWRDTFGPGSNAQVGTPGQNYTGTHGCVNVPAPVMKQLYAWATPGTPVQIVQ